MVATAIYNLLRQELKNMETSNRDRLPTKSPVETVEFMTPQTPIQTQIVELWQDILGDRVGIYDNFFELGGDSIKAALFFNRLQEKWGGVFYIVSLFEAPTVAEFEAYLHKYYPELVSQILGISASQNSTVSRPKIDSSKIQQLQQLIRPLPPRSPSLLPQKNLPTCFILSAPRSGSTLLRILLAGHPQLFAPPQLCLLQFNTLADRKNALGGEYQFWQEGAIQAIKQIENCSSERAIEQMQQLEAQQLTTQEFYQWLQQRLKNQLLVDKTTTYPLNLSTLQRAETDFDNPIYIHLQRHPYGAIHSFEEVKLDLTLAPFIPQLKDRDNFPFDRRELAELLWLISHQNILEFLQTVPQHRQYSLQFENLVTQPKTTIKNLCQFLGLDFYPEMLQPYADRQRKMTEGLNSQSGMLGDLKFYQHKSINPNVADDWKNNYSFDFLGEPTLEVARSLGYTQIISTLEEREDGEL